VLVQGNGDRSVAEAFDALAAGGREQQSPRRPWATWTARAIDRRDRDLLASFVGRVVIDVDGLGATLFCHGTPRDDEEPLTALTPERCWRAAREGAGQTVVVCGHTHMQFDRQLGPSRVVNAGAVGSPYEGRAGAYWLLLGPDVEHRRSDYDVGRAVAAMRAGGNPDVDGLVSESLTRPADPLEVAERLERQAGGPGGP
jgi:predicted phosphodiesterase